MAAKVMFCTKCGTKLPIDAKFCPSCGVPCSAQSSSPQCSQDAGAAIESEANRTSDVYRERQAETSMPFVPIAVHIKTGMLKKEAAAVLINQKVTVYILIGNDAYRQIQKDKGADIEGGYFKKTAGMMTAFRDYVFGLSNLTEQQIAQQYPTAKMWNTQEIRSLKIHLDYDASNEQYRNEYVFDLQIQGERIKGTMDPNMDLRGIKKPLQDILGRKFHH
ncbi:MAG: zinc-ribbon domain-containing protein [Anaerofustis sp.]